MDSQCKQILSFLKAGRGITQRLADDLFGVTRLGARIHDLKSHGYNIKSEWMEGENRFGSHTRFKRYFLS